MSSNVFYHDTCVCDDDDDDDDDDDNTSIAKCHV